MVGLKRLGRNSSTENSAAGGGAQSGTGNGSHLHTLAFATFVFWLTKTGAIISNWCNTPLLLTSISIPACTAAWLKLLAWLWSGKPLINSYSVQLVSAFLNRQKKVLQFHLLMIGWGWLQTHKNMHSSQSAGPSVHCDGWTWSWTAVAQYFGMSLHAGKPLSGSSLLTGSKAF